MVRWVEYAADAARTQRVPDSRVTARPDPAPHEQYLWDAGFHWGEWLEPGAASEQWDADQGHVGDGVPPPLRIARGAGIGRLLGHDAEAERLEELGDARPRRVAHRVRRRPDGSLDARHAGQPRPRAGVRPRAATSCATQTAARLVELIREAGTHLGTGFLATPYLLPVLADTGHLDVAYELLLQDTPPSWLAMVERGATTVWEDWEGIDDDGNAARRR